MFKNKSAQGKNNVSGANIYALRKLQKPKMSQRILAEKMQLLGVDMDKNAIQRIESGQRFVTDIELIAFTKVFNVDYSNLLERSDINDK